ncbi:MAG TPA: plastocyanin/azurin family copper-binding protein [Candidatus Thermoplasmatota archaeon]|nr:plastocyanin/azurin family copper-binding protein [Candidatus Thermoplasmatota archaeon]
MKAFASLAILSLTSLVLLAGCGAPAEKAPPLDGEGRYVIELTSGNQFSPATAKVPQGATVVWKHMGGAPHDVQAKDGSFSSGQVGGIDEEGETFVHQFNETGTFPYECHVHSGSGMKGTLTVG